MARIDGSTGSNSSYWRYYLVCTEQDVSESANTSKLKVEVYLGATSYSRASRGNITATHTVNVNGTNYTFETGAYEIAKNTDYKLGQIISNAIPHSADGSKTVSVSASSPDLAQAGGYGPYSGSASGSVVLTKIPRKSTVTCADGNIGSSTTININRASSSFTHTLKYAFGNLSGTIVNKTSLTNYGWTIPTSFYAQIPNAKYGRGTITCETYSGNTLIGSSTCQFNAFVVNSEPQVSATIVDSNQDTVDLTGDPNKLIKYMSNASISITATAQNSASISSQEVVCGDGKSSTNSSATLNNVESGSFRVSCTDSRGFSNYHDYSLDIIEYVKLAITNMLLARPSTTSDTINAIVEGNYFNDDFSESNSNSLSLKWRYRQVGGTWSAYTTINPTITNNTFSYSANLGNDYDYRNNYEFEFVAEDALMTITETRIVTQGKPIIDIGVNDVDINGEIKCSGIRLFWEE